MGKLSWADGVGGEEGAGTCEEGGGADAENVKQRGTVVSSGSRFSESPRDRGAGGAEYAVGRAGHGLS